MNSGEIIARHYATRQPVRLRWNSGRIVSLDSVPAVAEENIWLAPALMDVQVNGYAGVDFQRDDVTTDDLLKAVRGLRRDGCTQILATLITDEWPKLMARLKRLRQSREQSAELKSAIAGWHIEGPFLSAEPGYRGAHNAAVMCDPTPTHIDELRAATGNDPVLLTLAPERPGSLEAIRRAVSVGIKVSLGHTNASAEILREAVRAGASGFTHLGNGCAKEIDRHNNIIWRVFDTPGLNVGIIPDGIHIPGMFFRSMHRVLETKAIYYTTDAMAAAGAPPGRFTIGRLEVEVGVDQIVRQPGQTNFAGSALRPIDGVWRAAQMLNCPWQEVWDALSEHPRRWITGQGGLVAGQSADFCVLQFDQAQKLSHLTTYFCGET